MFVLHSSVQYVSNYLQMCEDGREILGPGSHEVLWKNPMLQWRSLKLHAAMKVPTSAQDVILYLNKYHLENLHCMLGLPAALNGVPLAGERLKITTRVG